MAWKGVHLTEPASLSIRQGQLLVKRDDGDITLALEDLAWLVIDNQRTVLTTAVMSACAEQGIAIVTSDARHMPASLALPFHTHHRTAAVAGLQLAASAPLKKRLWQSLVRAKIRNQSRALTLRGCADKPPLMQMADRVGSGDPDNLEAQAARAYWSALFADFTRGNESDGRNAALNYGYAVVRAIVARSLTACGLLPALGLYHASATNPFNLVDDIIEPFRPVADLRVALLFDGRSVDDQITKDDRQLLSALPLHDVMLAGGVMPVLHAAEACAQSLVRALEARTPALLQLPSVMDATS